MTGLLQPPDIIQLPDGRVIMAELNGKLHIGDVNDRVDADTIKTEVYLDMSDKVDPNGNKGWVNTLLDKDFLNNGYMYVYYARNDQGEDGFPINRFRVSRFKHKENEGGLSSRGIKSSEKVLWTDDLGYPSNHWSFHWHFGGQLSWGPDDRLYFATGDHNIEKEWSQDINNLGGCIVRMNKDGSFPDDNDGVLQGGAAGCWKAIGLRSPWRSRWDLPTGRYFIGDVGGNDQQTAVEEINVYHWGDNFTNFGWPNCEGPCDYEPFKDSCSCVDHVDPVYHTKHLGNSQAIIGGFVYRGDMFDEEEFKGAYFFADYSQNHIRYLKFDGTGRNVVSDHDFDLQADSVIALEVGPNGDIFVGTNQGGIHRYTYDKDFVATTPYPVKLDTCFGRCNTDSHIGGAVCQCDGQCQDYDDCCPDLGVACKGEEPLTTTTQAATTTTQAATTSTEAVTTSTEAVTTSTEAVTTSTEAVTTPGSPAKVVLKVLTKPADGIPMRVGGKGYGKKAVVDAEVGDEIRLNPFAKYCIGDNLYKFKKWGHGGDRKQVVQVTAAMTAKVQKLKAFYSKENKPSACAKINES